MLADKDNNADAPSADREDGITFRKPESQDGAQVHKLIAECKPLDENSLYCNLLQCTHFADTSVAAELDGDLVGFISGYLPPKQQNTLFVWQVAVHQRARGKGLAKRMLSELIGRPEMEQVQFIDTTITPDNEASWGMFRSFAYQRRMPTEEFILFDSRLHFSGQHKDEHLLRIGPFNLNDA